MFFSLCRNGTLQAVPERPLYARYVISDPWERIPDYTRRTWALLDWAPVPSRESREDESVLTIGSFFSRL